MDIETINALTRVPEMSTEEQELREWLVTCKNVLAGRTADEVAYFAILNNFDRRLVYKVVVHHELALRGEDIDRHSALRAFGFEIALEEFKEQRDKLERVPELDLLPLWKDVVAYQTGEVIR